MSITELRKNLAAAVDRVTADHDYTIITREGGKPAADSVDKVEPPAGPDNRTEAPATMQPASGTGLPVAQPAGAVAGTRARAFDASEGTPRDPLLDKTYDLNSPKQVPQLKP